MGALNFQNLKKTYTVNDSVEIHFNPADINFVNRMFDLMNLLEKKQKEAPPSSPEDIFTVAVKRDTEMREAIDKAFEEPVCDKVFGTTNVFTLAGGLPICMNFLMAVIDEIDAAADTERQISPAAAEYLKKYEAKYGSYMKK